MHTNLQEMKLGSKSSVGLGFRLHLGRIYKIEEDGGPTRWYYEDPSGSSHRLRPKNEGGIDYYFTDDATFIRAQENPDPNVGWSLWLPDGTLYEMEYHLTQGSDYMPNWRGWYTTRILAPVAPTYNWVEVTYDPNHPACILQISDSVNRTIEFQNAGSLGAVTVEGGFTETVEVPGFNGTIGTYALEYEIENVERPRDGPAWENNQLLLTRVVFPDPTYDLQFGYRDVFKNGALYGPITEVAASLGDTGWTQPVLTRYSYDKIIPNTFPGDLGDFIYAVDLKQIYIGGQGLVGGWTYTRSKVDLDGDLNRYVVKTDVRDSYGNETRFLFSGSETSDPNCPGQFTPEAACGDKVEGLLKRIERYHGPRSEGNLLQKEFRYYRGSGDVFTCDSESPCRFWNLVPYSIMKIFIEDGDKILQVVYDAWSGAHWTEKHESSYSTEPELLRIVRTGYEDPPIGSTRRSNWVLSTYDATEVLDPNRVPIARREFSFHDDGRIESRRDLIAPPNQSSAGDVVTTYFYDEKGNLDYSTVADSSGVGGTITTDFLYAAGVLKRVERGSVGWYELDQDIDPNTGLVMVSRDPSGHATAYDYDSLWRVETIVPPGTEEATRISYPDGLTTILEQGTLGTPDYVYQESRTDSLGRVVEQRRLADDGSVVKQVRTYLGPLPRVSFMSEWVAASEGSPVGTTYSYARPLASDPNVLVTDPYGRVHEIVTADGHSRTFSYVGLTEAVTIPAENGDPNLAAVTTTEKDALGRIVEVTPPPEAARVEHDYDLLGKLKEARLYSQQTGALLQWRSRNYDSLGRLTEVRDPETAHVPVTFDEYDARGNLREMTQADGWTISSTYDSADRLLTTSLRSSDPNGPAEVMLSRHVYDQDPNIDPNLQANSKGKVVIAESFDEDENLVVRYKYRYEELNGRFSSKEASFPDWDAGEAEVVLSTSYGYDNFGRVDEIIYPRDPNGARVPETVTKVFSHGYLDQITSTSGEIVTNIGRNPAGGLSLLESANGISTYYAPDEMNRPSEFRMKKGALILLNSGVIQYGRFGSVEQMGVIDNFQYDRVGRLVTGRTSGNGGSSDVFDLTYQYDPLGNMTSMEHDGIVSNIQRSYAPDANTNRLVDVGGSPCNYDGNGNLEGCTGEGMMLKYDHLSRLTEAGEGGDPEGERGEYAYDLGRLRVKRTDRTALRSTYYFRDTSGRVLSEFSKPADSSLDPHWNRDYVYAGERLVGIVRNTEPMEPAWRDSSATGSSVTLVWAEGADPDLYGYHVYRTTVAGSGYERINGPTTIVGTTFTDTDPVVDPNGNGVPTYYVISAVDFAGVESRYSDERRITAGDVVAPNVPTGLAATGGNGFVSLSWTTNGEADLAGYDIFRSIVPTGQGGTFTQVNDVPVAGTSFTDFSVTNWVRYYYKIKAVDTAANSSGFSNEETTIPHPPGSGGGGGGCPPQGCIGGDEGRLLLPPCRLLETDRGLLPAPEGVCLPGEGLQALADHSGDEGEREVLFVHTDHLRSVRLVTNELGEILSEHHYFPFGEEMPLVMQASSSKLFTGHERDGETGLLYMMQRHYDPRYGRFLQADPLVPNGAAVGDTWNGFAYVLNTPVSAIDPQGLFLSGVVDFFEGFFDAVTDLIRAAEQYSSGNVADSVTLGGYAPDDMTMVEYGFTISDVEQYGASWVINESATPIAPRVWFDTKPEIDCGGGPCDRPDQIDDGIGIPPYLIKPSPGAPPPGKGPGDIRSITYRLREVPGRLNKVIDGKLRLNWRFWVISGEELAKYLVLGYWAVRGLLITPIIVAIPPEMQQGNDSPDI